MHTITKITQFCVCILNTMINKYVVSWKSYDCQNRDKADIEKCNNVFALKKKNYLIKCLHPLDYMFMNCAQSNSQSSYIRAVMRFLKLPNDERNIFCKNIRCIVKYQRIVYSFKMLTINLLMLLFTNVFL